MRLSQKSFLSNDQAAIRNQRILRVARTLYVRVAQRQEVRTSSAFGTWTYEVQAYRASLFRE